MYAVYVLAAILLSVAPIHASTLVAALPSVASRQRAVSTRGCTTRQAEVARPCVTFPASRQHPENHAPIGLNTLVRVAGTPSLSPGIHLLGLAPNAP